MKKPENLFAEEGLRMVTLMIRVRRKMTMTTKRQRVR
jgi:hypothetical protein